MGIIKINVGEEIKITDYKEIDIRQFHQRIFDLIQNDGATHLSIEAPCDFECSSPEEIIFQGYKEHEETEDEIKAREERELKWREEVRNRKPFMMRYAQRPMPSPEELQRMKDEKDKQEYERLKLKFEQNTQ